MREIQLTQGKVALVDDEDFEALNAHKWCAQLSHGTFYARRCVRRQDGTWTYERMHRVVLGWKLGRALTPEEWPDHENGDGLDNQRGNLRLATRSQNAYNIHRRRANVTSQYLGVIWHKGRKRWRPSVEIKGKAVYLGLYKTELDAALAREVFIKAHPELMARSNFQGISL